MHFAEAGRRAPVLTRGRYTGNLVVVQPGDVEYPYNIEHQLSSVEEPIATPSYDDAPSYDGVQRKKKATILGGYDPAKEIKRALAQSIFACYQRAQAREGVQGGKLSVRFTILPNGRVSNFQFVEDSLNSPSVARCVRAMLSNYVFAAPERPQVVTFPFLFS
jgi:outer membrane biosynthesis protein TonB